MNPLLTLCGVLGALAACGAYLGLLAHRIDHQGYAWLNLASCALIGLSLFAQFNAGSLLMEGFFAAVSVWALLRKEPLNA